MSNLKVISALAIGLFSVPVAGEEELVRFTGGLQRVACPEVCGACCGDALVEEVNGGFSAHVAKTDYPLSGVVDDGRYYRLSGYFFRGAGACGTGDCTYFHLDALDAVNKDLEPVFDSDTRSLHLPSLLVDNRERWRVDLGAPYQITQAEFVETVQIVAQGGDCSALDLVCTAGSTCVGYFGIAGPAGPLFQTCEIPCDSDKDCPTDQRCTVVADGPGQVCQSL